KNKKPPKSGGYLLLVRFAAFPAGCITVVMQARLSACYRGNIASGAVVMRSSHGPHNEDTVLLYRTYCFWCAVFPSK
ncbi:TPA: hypothetical protein ACHK6K_001764, partial [Escherichia coli]